MLGGVHTFCALGDMSGQDFAFKVARTFGANYQQAVDGIADHARRWNRLMFV